MTTPFKLSELAAALETPPRQDDAFGAAIRNLIDLAKAASAWHALVMEDDDEAYDAAYNRLVDSLENVEDPAPDYVPSIEDNQLDTPIEVDRLENALRFIGNNCDNPEMVRHLVSRALRGKSLP